MNRTLYVNVKRENIAEGACKLPQRCMIAKAIKAKDPSITYVSVRTNGIKITRRKSGQMSERELWAVPLEAARAIIAFDADQEVEPFRFTAKLVERKLIARPTAAEKAKAHKRTQKRRAMLKARGLPIDTPSGKYGGKTPEGRVAGV